MSSAPPLSLDSPLPRNIGRYTLFDRIGRGGMADIFLARAATDLGAARLVVVKQILPHLAVSTEFSDLLISEAKLAARLNHANVVQVHDLGREAGFLFIAMEYVEGFDLNDLLKRCARAQIPLPVEYALLIAIEALRGLDYAHRRGTDDGLPLGIVHRDVSPSNVLISLEGEIKLCDFGIARANGVSSAVPDDVIRGKAGYMSPEQARGEALDARADVYAAGIILWELLAGRRLYRVKAEGSGPSLLEQARQASVPDLPSRGLAHEEELFAIARRALAPGREERYPSAQAFLRDLEGYVAKAKLIASPLRFGEWLMENFGTDLVELRRARERAARALEGGPAAFVEAVGGAAMAKTPPPVRVTFGGASLDHAQHESVEQLETTADQLEPAPTPSRPVPTAPPVPIYPRDPPRTARTAAVWALVVALVFGVVYAVLRLR